MATRSMRHFRFWCQSVLPLVYDDSLSYYEVLCKVVEYINKLIDTDKEIFKDLDELKAELLVVQKWIDDFDTDYIDKVISEFVSTMVFFGLTPTGYFTVFIPDSWDEITFETTGWDVDISGIPYGHLCLGY